MALFFRTFPVRYLGYGFPLAEALYFSFEEDHWTIDLSYSISGAFVLSHMIYNTGIYLAKGEVIYALASGLTTLLWESLASIILPSIIVYHSCLFVRGQHKTFLPTAVGICIIPLISTPIDFAIDLLVGFINPVVSTVV